MTLASHDGTLSVTFGDLGSGRIDCRIGDDRVSAHADDNRAMAMLFSRMREHLGAQV